MKLRRHLIAAVLLTSSVYGTQPLSADEHTLPLTAEQLGKLGIFITANHSFSAGWTSIKSVVIGSDRLLRFLYRRSDGLTMALLQDHKGNIYGTSNYWMLRAGMDSVDVTLLNFQNEGSLLKQANVNILVYNSNSGDSTEYLLYWNNVNDVF